MEDWRPIAEAVTTFYLHGDPATSEWSEQLLLRAADDLAMAQAALRQMRRAVVAQFFDACWIMVPAAT
jgi:hypothetical protein